MSWMTNSGRCTPMRMSELLHAEARTSAIGVSTCTCESAIVATWRARKLRRRSAGIGTSAKAYSFSLRTALEPSFEFELVADIQRRAAACPVRALQAVPLARRVDVRLARSEEHTSELQSRLH